MQIQNKTYSFNVIITFCIFIFTFLIFPTNFNSLEDNTVFAQLSDLNDENFENIGGNIKQNITYDKSITVNYDNFKYYNDEIIKIYGNVYTLYDNNLNLTESVLSITPTFTEVSYFPFLFGNNKPITLQKIETPAIDGSYNYSLYLSKPGLYNISISEKGDNKMYYVEIEAKNKLASSTFKLIYITIALLILYGIFTWNAIKNQNDNDNKKKSIQNTPKTEQYGALTYSPSQKITNEKAEKISDKESSNKESIDISKFRYEIYRFFVLSAISLIPLISFFVMDVEIGKFSPIGIVRQDIENDNNIEQERQDIENDNNIQPDIIEERWIINIGGSVSDDYRNGISIPFYVFAFGWMGGYLRYLYKVVTKIRLINEDQNELNTALWLYLRNLPQYIKKYKNQINILPLFLYSSFEELAEILLSPLLAIAVWLLLRIAADTNIFTASLISFSVGLITKDVVSRIIEFSRNTIGQQSRGSNETIGPPTQGTY